MACEKEEGHFDGASFGVGAFIVLFIAAVALGFTSTDRRSIKREAELPKRCEEGQQVLMTTAPTAELWACESHWVRK